MEDNYNDRIINDALRVRGYYPLRPMQLWIVDSQFYKAKSTMMNLSYLFKLAPEIDLKLLAQVLSDFFNSYDVFRCRLVFHPETNDICQRFDGEIFPITIEKISDEEFEQRKKTLARPYNLINNPLYRVNLFETPTAKYIFVDFYHTIMDGLAIFTLFLKEINMRYKGKKITRTPASYADYILEDMKVSTEEFEAGKKYWMDTLNKFDVDKHFIPPDLMSFETYSQTGEVPIEWKKGYTAIPVENVTQKYFIETKNKEHIFFFAATMLAFAKSTGAKNAIMDWIHIGRYNSAELRLMGAMLEQFPICCEFEDGMSVADLLKNLDDELNTCFKYRKSLGAAYNSGKDLCCTFAFQKKFHSSMENLKICGYPAQLIELPPNEWSATENTLDVEVNLTDEGTYYIEYSYDAGSYSEKAIKNFAALIDEIILKLQDEKLLIADIFRE